MTEIFGRMREWFASLFRGARVDAELREEMQLHLEMEAAANRARGLDASAAWRAARAKFGGTERFVEEVRDARGGRGLLDFGRDLRIAARGLRRAPGFTLVVILALALGIGATTAVFGLIDRVLLRPIPGVVDASELVLIRMQEDEFNYTGLSYLNYLDLRAAAPALSGFAGFGRAELHVAPPAGDPVVLAGEAVLGDYFGTLGLQPAQGRFFTPEELGTAADPFVLVLGYDAARRLYPAGDAVGSTVRANGHVFTVIGVAPSGFQGVRVRSSTEAWVPPAAYAELRHMRGRITERRFSAFMQQFGRLAPDATPELAQAQLRARMAQLIEAYPGENGIYEEQPPTVTARLGLGPGERRTLQTMLVLLFGVSLLVLVIACANVANLLLFRGVVRRGEAAVRRALGASLPRMLQHHLAEGLILAGAGALGGIVVAYGLTGVLTDARIIGELAYAMSVDVRVLAFTTFAALLVSLLFAAIPVLMTRGLDLVATLRQASRGETARIGLARGGLVVIQLGASVALLVCSLLMARTLRALSDVELGFDAERTLAFSMSEEEQGYDRNQLRVLQQQLLARVAMIPGVASATVSSGAPFLSATTIGTLRHPSWSAETRGIRVRAAWIGPDYFRTLGIPILRGRAFRPEEAADSTAAHVILTRSAAVRLFGSIDVVGRTVAGGFIRDNEKTIIGVVDDIQYVDLRDTVEPGLFEPVAAYPLSGFELIVRLAGERSRIEAEVREIMSAIDPEMPFTRVGLLSEGVRRAIARERFIARATFVLAGIAGVLAALGLYGLLAYAVAQRRREIGIRIALGARPSDVVAWVSARMLMLAAAGILIGLLGGGALGSALRAHLFGVEPIDAMSSAIAGVILLTVGAVAAALPARAAASVQPAIALRSD